MAQKRKRILVLLLGAACVTGGFLSGCWWSERKWFRQYPALRRVEGDNLMSLMTLRALRAGKTEYGIRVQENELDLQAFFFADLVRGGHANSREARMHLKMIREYRATIDYAPLGNYGPQLTEALKLGTPND